MPPPPKKKTQIKGAVACVQGNGLSDPSSNSGQGCVHFPSNEMYESNSSPSSDEYIEGQIGLFDLGMATGLRVGIQSC